MPPRIDFARFQLGAQLSHLGGLRTTLQSFSKPTVELLKHDLGRNQVLHFFLRFLLGRRLHREVVVWDLTDLDVEVEVGGQVGPGQEGVGAQEFVRAGLHLQTHLLRAGPLFL